MRCEAWYNSRERQTRTALATTVRGFLHNLCLCLVAAEVRPGPYNGAVERYEPVFRPGGLVMGFPPSTAVPGPAGCADLQRTRQLSRRDMLQVGSLGIFGLGLTDLLTAQARVEATSPRPASARGKARSCILMFMWGGPSQLDTWDLKPSAPADVRGEFQPIATSVPGLQISEHFPLLATQAHRYTIIRSMTHDDPAHLSSVHHAVTGRHAPTVKSDAAPASRQDTPHVGSMLSKLRPSQGELPSFVSMPWFVSHPAAPGGKAPGQNGGWLGETFDPFLIAGDPNAANFSVAGLRGPADVPLDRFDERQTLLKQLDSRFARTEGMTTLHERAFGLLRSASANGVFDLNQEPAPVRERYGRNTHGQCLLLARRLVEAGVRLVCVNWHQDGRFFWDTHEQNFTGLKNRLMPPADRGFSALLEDLAQRGLLDETLLVWVGEFGRSPRISKGQAGREHWPSCYSAVLAGGGIRGGQVHGRSDNRAAFPAADPVAPGDLTATIYHALGISPDIPVLDREGRQVALTEGTPLRTLFS
jgi:hypothetical protein